MKQHQVVGRRKKEMQHPDPEVIRQERLAQSKMKGDQLREEGRRLALSGITENTVKLLLPLELDG